MDDRAQIWQPLNQSRREIRLFILHPSTDFGTVPEGHLITVSLDQQVQYEAISHAWGGPTYRETIFINQVEWPVTVSIFKALRQLRLSHAVKCIWIDALCINQYDMRERADQVEKMQFIFNRATTVVAWLGCSNRSIASLVGDLGSDKISDKGVQGASNRLFRGNEARISLFARLDYWSRTWIFQELALGREIRLLYADKVITMGALKAIVSTIESQWSEFNWYERDFILRRLRPILRAPTLCHIATVGSHEEKAVALTRTMYDHRISQCHDPRDRIYGLLGLMTAMFGPDFMEVNYQDDVAEIYVEFCGRSWWSRSQTLKEVLTEWRTFYSGVDLAFVRTIAFGREDLLDFDMCCSAFATGPSSRTEQEQRLVSDIKSAAEGRRFFIDAAGRPGLGPLEVRPGDVLAILAGGRVPYVLRKSTSNTAGNPNNFYFIGECYVDGVMQGQLLDGPTPPALEEIWLE
ncbi:hypothetical protein H2200_007993 [Cladophialophora chaetospira]|uniref:Heterokaryon incompatibility domain-containing protein n=1 Tax=Cladophialophora chaetospira TaxID=386627 RepID=A0AA38X6W5_9EURO|nr:hypothetical protein H2200_007993 [Cladophialophora chaetospira]